VTLEFDLQNVIVTEFGVGRDDGHSTSFVAVPVNGEAQRILREMVVATWEALHKNVDHLAKYEPSEKHGNTECLYLPLNDQLSASVRELHEAANIALDSHALTDASTVSCYFVRLTDNKNRRLTALKRASQFKGILKKHLLRFVTDSLQLIEDRVFKLDNDFDVVIDSANVHILRPKAFEFIGNLEAAILKAVPHNVTSLQKDLSFVNFVSVQRFAENHPRAARYLASIREQKETKNIDMKALRKHCKDMGVEVRVVSGKLTVNEGHEMKFLEVLDRRLYGIELVKGQPERFKATSRKKISG